MDYKEIKILLDKYFEGNSSLNEEKLLQEYFTRNENIPDDLLYAKEIFSHFRSESAVHFEDTERRKMRINSKNVLRIMGVAASIAVFVSIIMFFKKPKEKKVYAVINGVEITDRNIAIHETKKALLLISDNLNQGTRDLSYLSKFNEVERLVSKNK